MKKSDLTCPPLENVSDYPENQFIIVSWLENEQRWFRIVKYDDLPNFTIQKIMTHG